MTARIVIRTMGIMLAASLAACGLISPNPAGSGGRASARYPAPGGTSSLAPYDISRLVNPGSGKYLGVEANGVADSLDSVRKFSASIDKKPNIIGEYISWGSSFAPQPVLRNWSYGALTYLAWEPYDVTVRSIAKGHSDVYLTRFARAVRALNLPLAISFGHEMNGFWYPWGTRHTTHGDFVAAWRRIHDLFAKADARNVIWIWNPNVIPAAPQVRLRLYYPGKAYVDWVGITGYFTAAGPDTFATLYEPTIKEIHAFTHKPVLIAETSVETGPDEVADVNHLIGTVTRRNMLGLIWYDHVTQGVDWRAESRPILRASLARDLAPVRLVVVN